MNKKIDLTNKKRGFDKYRSSHCGTMGQNHALQVAIK
jgi:hypothetical protein